MTSPFSAHRPVVMGTHWMITSGHPLASQAGAAILERGGNAIDAAIAANAVLNVVRPHMCGIGGDAFFLFYWAKEREIKALNATGRAPDQATRDFFVERGMNKMPANGILTATVPGAVDGWCTALERYGTLPLSVLLERAVEYAAKGFPIYKELSQVIANSAPLLKKTPDGERIFFKNGRPPEVGEILVQPELAESLAKVGKGGGEIFYRGEIAKAIVEFSRQNGGFFSARDFAETRSAWVQFLETTYKGYRICVLPPNSQGIALPMQLNIIENFDLPRLGHNSADYVHLLVEAKKLAFADRNRYVCDPDFNPVPVGPMLAKDHGKRQSARIDFSRAGLNVSPAPFTRQGEDTVYLAVVDREGNAVSMIQSLYESFGSGIVVAGTGILLHNRARGFTFEPGHPNCLAPRKRPYHTLTPCLIMKEDHPYMVLGTPGADGQTQTILQVMANIFDFHADIQEAIESPRWRSNPDDTLSMESRFPSEVIEGLRQRGHAIELLPPWSPACGNAQGIILQENGVLMGGADPRRSSYVIGR